MLTHIRSIRWSTTGRLAACALLLSAAACGDDGTGSRSAATGGNGDPGMGIGGGAGSTDPVGDSTGAGGAGSGSDNGLGCEPPDVLLVLDRTMSMHRMPNGTPAQNTADGRQLSKWYLAIDAIESLVDELDTTIRFGLELFPVDPGMEQCVTLTERIGGTKAKNPQCEAGEILVSPDLGTAASIGQSLVPESTRLCRSTPIGAGLETAAAQLRSVTEPNRDRLAVLLTDGQDTCDEARSLAAAQQIAADGGRLYVIGFDGSGNGVDNGHLNDLACAGRTAKGFPDTCSEDADGHLSAADREGPALYILAEDQAQLSEELEQVAGSVCCNCLI